MRRVNHFPSTRVFLSIGLGLALVGSVLIGLNLSAKSARAQGPIYVDASVIGGSHDGSSWTDAFTNVQDALAGAADGDEIWVVAGVYYPDEGTGQIDNDSNSTFQLVNGVALYGGFSGGETQLSQRDWQANVTVLSGDLQHDDITDADDVVTDTDNIVGSNAYHVVTGSGVTETARLDGFTITAGQANDSGSPDHSGGGMYNSGGSPTLFNLTFSGNHANVNGGGMYNEVSSPTLNSVTFTGNYVNDAFGGGMCNVSGSNPTLTDVTFDGNVANQVQDGRGGGMFNDASSPELTQVTFSGNQAEYGGGMDSVNGSSLTLTQVAFNGNEAVYGGGMRNDASSPTLVTVTFSSNEAPWGYGAGMYNDNGSHPTLTAVTFDGNQAEHSGGGLFNRLSHPTLTDVTFDHNHADDDGGGLYNVDSDPTLIDVTFSENTAEGVSGNRGGGGMYNVASSPTLSNVAFISNTSTQDGGGIYNFTDSGPRMTNVAFRGNSTVDGVGGGIYSYEATITLTNAIFSGNWGRWGGGIYNRLGSAVLTNTTFGGNATVDNGNFHYNPGGAIFNYDGTATLVNCILWGNAGEQIYDQWASTSTISYSDVAWSGGVYTGVGNISADPQFIAPVTVTAAPTTTGDYRLLPTSPAIDAGDNNPFTATTAITTDMDGNPRRVDVPAAADTGCGTPPIVDMGAYEAQYTRSIYLPLVVR